MAGLDDPALHEVLPPRPEWDVRIRLVTHVDLHRTTKVQTFLSFLKTAHPVSTAAVFTLTPLMSAGFGWVLLRQITTNWMFLALGMGAIGALWVIFRADWAAFRRFEVGQGEIYYFWGCVAHAAYTPMVRKLNRGERPDKERNSPTMWCRSWRDCRQLCMRLMLISRGGACPRTKRIW